MSESMLHFTILDLTHDFNLCGKVLADLGCEVIKIEDVGGDASRDTGPFFQNIPDRQKSLNWIAFNSNKKGITLNLETEDGRTIFKKLVTRADAVIESFTPGYMEGLGLGYAALSAINPKIIMTSITCFGQDGPYAGYRGSDLVCHGMSGALFLTGDPEEPPMKVSIQKNYLSAAVDAAVATLMALYYRETSGEGQYIDVSAQASEVLDTANAVPFWEEEKTIQRRAGQYRSGLSIGAKQRQTWPCKDGYVSLSIFGGRIGAKTNKALVDWMDSAGFPDEVLKNMDWAKFDMAAANPETHHRMETALLNFFKNYTKLELYEEAKKRRIMIYPVFSVGELAESPQLKAREFWQKEDHPELGTSFTIPGPFTKSTEPLRTKCTRAPLIGEHNEEIYLHKLGMTQEELLTLKQSGVI